jgi:hypothetical protein
LAYSTSSGCFRQVPDPYKPPEMDDFPKIILGLENDSDLIEM